MILRDGSEPPLAGALAIWMEAIIEMTGTPSVQTRNDTNIARTVKQHSRDSGEYFNASSGQGDKQ